MKRLLFVAPQAKFFLSHRVRLAIAAREAGWEVAIACPSSAERDEFDRLGLSHIDLPFARGGRNPLGDVRTVSRFARILDQFQPSVVHLITAKATLYGGMLARLRSIPTVAAITGLGFLFTDHSAVNRVVRTVLLRLYRIGLNRPDCCVVFQNTHDRDIFARAGVLKRSSQLLLPGAGADLSRIVPQPLPDGVPSVVLPARMLRMKGVEDFVEAARILHDRNVRADFRLVGDPDEDNPTSVTRAELERWSRDGHVAWSGHRNDIERVLAEAHAVALPSRGGEGLPKTLVDAAAAGRAAVATDVPGCRDAIVEGETGLLCRPGDPFDLAEKLEALLTDPQALLRMGEAARRMAESRFDVREVVAKHLDVYQRLAEGTRSSGGGSIARSTPGQRPQQDSCIEQQ